MRQIRVICVVGLASLALGLSGAPASVVPITSGDAGGGVNLSNPASIVYAVDFFGQQTSPLNSVQNVPFQNDVETFPGGVITGTAYGGKVIDTVTTNSAPGAASGQVNGGGPSTPAASLSNNDGNSMALENILTSIYYGQQHIVITGLTDNAAYNVQLLISDGSYNERVQDTAYASANGGATDTGTNVPLSTGLNISDNVVADGTGAITIDLTPNANSGDHNPVLGGLVVSSVPEPSALGVLALAGLSALSRRRRV